MKEVPLPSNRRSRFNSSSARLFAGLIAFTFLPFGHAIAQNIQFDGGTSNPGDWNDPTNWSGDVLPSAGNPLTDIGVNPTLEATGILNATANITGPLTNDTIGELRVGRGNGAMGVVNHSAGTLSTGGWGFVGVDADAVANSGTYNLSGAGALTHTGERFYLGLGGGGGFNQGTLTISDMASGQFNALIVGGNDGNQGTITQTGGSLTYNNWMTVGESGGAQGVYDISGGSLTQNADFLTVGEGSNATGTVTVSGTADVNLNGAGLTLGRRVDGTGSLHVIGSTATINTTGLLAGIDTDDPLAMIGSGSGTIEFTADALGVTTIFAAGDVRLNDGTGVGSSTLNVDLSLAPATGDILLIDVLGQQVGTFAGLAEGALVANSGGRRITYTYGDGNDIALLIPEPSSLLFLFMGTAVAFVRRRKRN